MASKKSSYLEMDAAYHPLTSQQMDELEDAEILTLLQSSDAESSSDNELVLPSNKKVSSDPSSGDSSVWKAAANLVNFMEGIGFLAIPYALKEGGIIAMVMFIIIPIIMWYIGTVLTECLYDEDEQGNRHKARSGYKDLGDVLLPKYGGYIVSGIIQLDVFLLAVSYLILFGSVMRHDFPSLPITERMWIGIAGGLVLPTVFLKSLSQIAWLSATSVIALIAVVVYVVWYGAENTNEWDLSTLLLWDTEGVVLSLSILLYSFTSFTIIPSVEGSMADKAKFGTALTLAYVVSTSMKVSFAVFAFLSFGANTYPVILNSLPSGPVHITVGSFFALNCILSYGLVIYPVFQSLHRPLTTRIQNDKIPDFVTSAVIRVTVVVLSVVVAILVPNFLVIVSFIGSVLESPACYIFPIILRFKLKYKRLKIHQVCVDSFVVIFGIIALLLGVPVSIKTLLNVNEQ